MKPFVILFCILVSIFPVGVFATELSEVSSRVGNVQGSTPTGTPTAPTGMDQKGFIGEILSRIFEPTGMIKTVFLTPFQNIFLNSINNVPKWNGQSFITGTMTDIGGRIGIGTVSPATQLHTTGTARFDGGIQSGSGNTAIASSNAYHTARSTTDTLYGYYNMLNASGVRGAYIGGGNGSDRVDLYTGTNNLYINTSGNVGIGVSSPTEKLDVNGKIRMRVQTTDTDTDDTLVTKGYVDSQSAVGLYEGYIEKPMNFGEDRGTVVPYSAASPDTCNGDESGGYSCDANEVNTCRDNYVIVSTGTRRIGGGNGYDETYPIYTNYSTLFFCTRATYLVKEEYPDNGGILNKTGTATITGRDYSGWKEGCTMSINLPGSPSCNVSRSYGLGSKGLDGECRGRMISDLRSGTICENIKGITKAVFVGTTNTINIEYYGF